MPSTSRQDADIVTVPLPTWAEAEEAVFRSSDSSYASSSDNNSDNNSSVGSSNISIENDKNRNNTYDNSTDVSNSKSEPPSSPMSTPIYNNVHIHNIKPDTSTSNTSHPRSSLPRLNVLGIICNAITNTPTSSLTDKGALFGCSSYPTNCDRRY